MSPKTGAVLADTPTFLLKLAFAGCGLQRPARLAGGPSFVRIELREMPANDFARSVALDPFRSEVPVGDLAVGVDHVDGVVGDALHKEPELLFAELELPLGILAFGEVARDLGVSQEVAG